MSLTVEQRLSLDRKNVNWRRVDFVEPSDVLEALRDGNALVVDARAVPNFERDRFPGSVSARGYDALLALPKERALYLYCT
jgi:hypothetical protein